MTDEHIGLKEYIDRLIVEVNERFQDIRRAQDMLGTVHMAAHTQEHQMLQRAIDKSEESLNKRLEGMNEFREQLSEQAGRFVTIVQFDERSTSLMAKVDTALHAITQRIDSNSLRVHELERQKANLDGRMWGLGAFLVVLQVMIQVISYFFKH
jgi:chromosome segregation ATPase